MTFYKYYRIKARREKFLEWHWKIEGFNPDKTGWEQVLPDNTTSAFVAYTKIGAENAGKKLIREMIAAKQPYLYTEEWDTLWNGMGDYDNGDYSTP